MDLAEPLTLPAAAEPVRRAPVPKLAALVPLVAGVVLWAVTGSLLALCFAALGPLMMLASFADGARQRRREQRRAAEDAERQWERAHAALVRRHDAERDRLLLRHPGLRECLTQTPLAEPAFSEQTLLVLGRGETKSPVRVTGGDDERADRFRERAARLDDAPVTVAVGGGVAVRGTPAVASAVARALVVQLCARFPSGRLALVGDGLEALGLDGVPQAHPGASGPRLAVHRGARGQARADAAVYVLDAGDEVPEGLSTVLDCEDPTQARVRTTAGVRTLTPETLSLPQTAVVATAWAREAGAASIPATLDAAELPVGGGEGLSAVIGRGEQGDVRVDIVTDGPHALVTGTTGTGKSELLITWITAIARAHSAEAVNFVLADFKGGTAFVPLRELPHVAAVITDLDEEGAQRGVMSLRAELRRREEVLADAGARDIAEPGVALARLVIVVDEFAALLHEHPDLAAVFTDIAARGRALGMHLILGTQRASGVVREALAANCPLRLSLRVTDAGDSRMILGTDDAVRLPGDRAARGLALIRRPQDEAPVRMRVALTGAVHLAQVCAERADARRAQSPWLPALPARIDAAALSALPGTLIVGLADEPERQRQEPVRLRLGHDRGLAVFGGPQSGKSTLLGLLHSQHPEARWIGPDPEQAWDAVTAILEGEDVAGLILCDDLDALIAAFPGEYAHAFVDRLEQALRHATARGATAVVTAARLTGPVLRIADLLPVRALLALPSRADHLAAGGTADTYLPRRVPGRAHIDGREVQFACGPAPQHPPASVVTAPVWRPGARTAVVGAHPTRQAERLARLHPEAIVRLAMDEQPGTAFGDAPLIVVGDAEMWQRQWALWQRLRAEGDVVVQSECTTELRTLVGVRVLPPFARSHAGRAWLLAADGAPRRIEVAALGLRR